MAVINHRTRFAASSEQQKTLQRNISLQAEAARHTRDGVEAAERKLKLEQLAMVECVTNRQKMDDFIGWCLSAVIRAEANSRCCDLTSDYDRFLMGL